MSSVIIAGDTSGSVTLQAPATAGSTVVNLPSTLGNTGTSSFATTDASGNLGLGVTPSALSGVSGYRVLQVASAGNGITAGLGDVLLTTNSYYDTGWKYGTSGVPSTTYNQNNGAHIWKTAASGTAGNAISFTQAMTLDASGNLGVGSTSPSATAKITIRDASNGVYRAENTVGGYAIFGITANASSEGFVDATNTFNFKVDGTERARVNGSGNLLVGGTTQTNSAKVEAFFSGASNSGFVANDTTSTSGTNYFIASNNGTNIGSIQRVGATSAVVYNTTSDQRLKSNIEDALPVLEKLMQVQVRQYDWTEGDLHQDYGFIAQELQTVLTGVVTQGQTEEDVWQLDYSRLTPHLVKAIQEQQTLITQLQADVAALKGQP